MADTAVGIDLGTTYSVVASLDNDGRPWTVQNAEGDITTPSVVFFDPEGPIVGKEAVKAAEFDVARVAKFAKRNMGDEFFGSPVCGHRLPPEVIQALVLRKLREDAALKLGDVKKAVVTVPAYFNEPRRKATQDAALLAGIEVLDIINEPTAAAISYGVQKGFLSSKGESQAKETILIYDLGGGTFDVTLMEIEGPRYDAIATAGDIYLGGLDWDLEIVDYVADWFVEKFGVDPRDDSGANQSLLAEATDCKHALTVRESVNIQFAFDGNRARIPFTRHEFEERTAALLDRTILTVRRVLRESKREWSDLTRILLVGGSTRMPMVQNALERESGLVPERSLSPDEAVAHGAAVYAGILAKNDRLPLQGMSLTNVNSHDLGVLGIESKTGMKRRQIMIPRNSQLPVACAKKFVTHRDGQSTVRVMVVEGGDASGNHATRIGKCVVSDLPTGLPAHSPIKVTFNYGANGRLTVGASIPGTDRRAKMEIQRSSGLDVNELAQWQQRIADNEFFVDQVTEESAEPDVAAPEAIPATPQEDSLEVVDFSAEVDTEVAAVDEIDEQFVFEDEGPKKESSSDSALNSFFDGLGN